MGTVFVGELKVGGRFIAPLLCLLVFCHMHCSRCLHWPLCQWQTVASVCTALGSALSLRLSVHGRKGTGGKAKGRGLRLHMPTTDRKKREKDIQKKKKTEEESGEWNQQRESLKRRRENEDIPAVSSERVSGYLHCGITATGLFSCLQHSWSLMYDNWLATTVHLVHLAPKTKQ